MTQKKNGFLNFCFSLLPGAGQMYQGFMKRGVSIMTLFFGWLCVSTVFHIEELLYFIPVIWFFGFFDSLNLNSLSDEERLQREDAFLFLQGEQPDKQAWNKMRIPVALLLIFFGGYTIVTQALEFLMERNYFYWDNGIVQMVYNLPNLAFSVVIILLGIWLIVGKKREIDESEEKTFSGEEPEKEQQRAEYYSGEKDGGEEA